MELDIKKMENLLNNSWVITIVGGITVVVIGYHFFGIGKEKKSDNKRDAGISTLNIFSEDKNKLVESDLIPQKIVKDIDGYPPFQRKIVAASYKGIKVNNWKVTLKSVSRRKNGWFHLMFWDRGNYPWIYVDVQEKDYPVLRLKKEGESFTLSGKIKEVEGNVITIESSKLEL